MRKKLIINTLILMVLMLITNAIGGNFFSAPISREKLKLLPVPIDYRNYFFFQSIDDTSYILIGDFTGAEKFFSQIIDENCDNKINRVVEYYPERNKFTSKKISSSRFFTNLKDFKLNIITGEIFAQNYSYKMKSLPTLKYKLDEGSDIFQYEHGYTVKFYDPDAPTTIMSEFFFGKKDDRYDLIFKTNYYKLYRMKIKPPMKYSVFCKNTKDPVVAETVENLLKMIIK